jgi:hypothetical protein
MPVAVQSGTAPGGPPVPPPAASNVPIRLAICCSAGPKFVSQIDEAIPFAPNADTHSLMRTLGSAKLPSAAMHECATTGHGHDAAPHDVSITLGFFHVTV